VLIHKICLIGSFGVGKTSLVRRFVTSMYSDRYLTTVGVRVDKKELRVGDEDVTLVIWDLAGEEDPSQISLAHLRGMSGYLLVADGTRERTFAAALRLQAFIEAEHGKRPFLFLLNKGDLKDAWAIAESEVAALRAKGWPVLETSAKDGTGVEAAFHELAAQLLVD